MFRASSFTAPSVFVYTAAAALAGRAAMSQVPLMRAAVTALASVSTAKV